MTPVTLGLCLSIGLLTGPLLALACSKPDPGSIALVISPPWIERDTVIEASNGRLIGPTSAFLGSFAISTEPEFAQLLKENGIWFVVDGSGIASLCGITI